MSQGDHAVARDTSSWQHLVDETLPAVTWSTDRELIIVTCQGTALGTLGKPLDQLPGAPLRELFPGVGPDAPLLAAHRSALGGEHRSIALELSGRTFRGKVSPMRRDGSIVGCAAVAMDLPLVNDRCQSIADTAVDLILFLKPDGTIEDLNRTAKGTSRERVIGKSVYEFTPPESHDRIRDALRSVLETGKVVTVEVKFPSQLGRESWQALRIGPLRRSEGIVGLVLLAADITQRKLALENLQAEEALLRHLLNLQDRERRLIAYEIHDGFIQDVIGARMLLQGLEGKLNSETPAIQDQLENSLKLLGRAVREGRRLISELRPMIIDEMGIVEAIQYLVEEEEARGEIEVNFTHRVQFDRLPPLLQATMFRIVREAANNAKRHGKASRLNIRLTEVGSHVILEIQDNGRGFDLSTVPPDRFGLRGIQERAKLFGGGATIESRRGHGTRITVKLPTEIPQSTPANGELEWVWSI